MNLLKILLVEDNAGDVRLLQETLRDIETLQFEITTCSTLARALELIGQSRFDIGLLDLGLPDAQGLEVVRGVRAAAPDIPLVVLTGLKDENLAVQSLQEGSQDYLVKGEITAALLSRALRYAMERQRVQVEMRALSLI